VTDIVRTAVLGSYGVAGFATPDPWGYVVRWLGLGEPGIRIGLDDLRVELHIRVAYGLPVAEVARQVESAVRYALRRDLDREPSEVVIHIDGLAERDGGCPSSADRATRDGPGSGPRSGAGGATGRPQRQRRIRGTPVTRRWCDGTGLIEALRAAVANLDAHVDEINALNVFPVPDGDTGSNMVATMLVALEQAETVAGEPAWTIAGAIKRGALHGARGNSGVILSQILAGWRMPSTASAGSTASTSRSPCARASSAPIGP